MDTSPTSRQAGIGWARHALDRAEALLAEAHLDDTAINSLSTFPGVDRLLGPGVHLGVTSKEAFDALVTHHKLAPQRPDLLTTSVMLRASGRVGDTHLYVKVQIPLDTDAILKAAWAVTS